MKTLMRKEPQLLVAPIAPNLKSVRLCGLTTARLTLSLSHTAACLHLAVLRNEAQVHQIPF